MTTQFKDLTNYEKLLQTADKFRFSQGFYGRLYESLKELDEDTIQDVNNIESLFSAQDTLDVVMYLEG